MRSHNNRVYAYRKIIIVSKMHEGEKSETRNTQFSVDSAFIFRQINLHFHSIMIYYAFYSLRPRTASHAKHQGTTRRVFDDIYANLLRVERALGEQ